MYRKGRAMNTKDELEAKWDVQLRKGSLELVVLAVLKGRRLYGLELLGLLQGFETTAITEGTLYPLLDRLKRDGVVEAGWEQLGDAKPRKYYQLNARGEIKLADFTHRWRQSVSDIEYLLSHPGPRPLNRKGQAE